MSLLMLHRPLHILHSLAIEIKISTPQKYKNKPDDASLFAFLSFNYNEEEVREIKF